MPFGPLGVKKNKVWAMNKKTLSLLMLKANLTPKGLLSP